MDGQYEVRSLSKISENPATFVAKNSRVFLFHFPSNTPISIPFCLYRFFLVVAVPFTISITMPESWASSFEPRNLPFLVTWLMVMKALAGQSWRSSLSFFRKGRDEKYFQKFNKKTGSISLTNGEYDQGFRI
jgi:hypothetical protein